MKRASIAAALLTLLGVLVIIIGARYADKKSTEQQLPVSTAREISFAQVQQNNTLQNCWVVYGGRVLDISRKSSQAGSTVQAAMCGTALDILPPSITKDSLAEYQIGIVAP
jgi:hypothetical protein